LRVISKTPLRAFGESHDDAMEPLLRWHRIAKAADWSNPSDVRVDFGHADFVDEFTVFNIGGGKYRLIAEILYRYHIVYVRHVLTHHEYSKGKWKV
jgi:mRNA interferase HigB